MFLNEYAPSLTARRPMKPTSSQTLRSSFAFVAVSIALVAGCAESAESPTDVLLERNFQLQVGQSAHVAEANLTVGFQGVSSDSRCGKGEACVWEGDAIVRIWVQQAGEAKQERELHTGSKMPSAADYAGYGVLLVSLSPAPISGRSIEPTQYVATLQVTRGLSGGRNIY